MYLGFREINNNSSMKKIAGGWLLVFLLALPGLLKAQILDKTTESYRASKMEVNEGEVIELIFEVRIEKDWYIYSSDVAPDIGPIPTTFSFNPHPGYALVGGIVPIGSKKKFDKTWEAEVTYFEKVAEFRQKVKILKAGAIIEGSFEFQSCSNITGQCLRPETVDFKLSDFKIKAALVSPAEDPEKGKKKTGREGEGIQETSTDFPDPKTNPAATDTAKSNTTDQIGPNEGQKPRPAGKEEIFVDDLKDLPDEEAISLVRFMLLAFLAGFAALLTPCVFPMIPMTVTFFTKNRRKADTSEMTEAQIKALEAGYRREALRKALFYGFSIIGIYTLLGTAISWINGPAFANWLSTHWIPNLFFFVVFFIFALSFLGMFEIVLPSTWVNRADREADKGGYYGIFFMAFTLTLVSFSCTGPIVGAILVQSAGGAIIKPILGMFAFSLAIALPFALFAAFPTWLNSLPKSGGWLNSVKVVLGFLELALAFKFLSIADQVYHWGILDRDVFLAIWITIFALIGFYLLGKIRMPHDSPLEKLSVSRVLLAMASFAFVVYMLPGLYGAPLKPLSGYLPPQTTIDFDLVTNQEVERIVAQKIAKALQEGENIVRIGPVETAERVDFTTVRHADLFKLPHGLEGFFDFKQGLAYAQKVNKPVFIDFTGHGCVNCREMEATVWSDPEVLRRLQEAYVVIALYVDDKKLLPEKEWYRSNYDQKLKKTIGDQNADLQIVKFNNNAQPFYILLDTQGQLLAKPKAYDLNPKNFVKFLDEGLLQFEKRMALARQN